MPLYSRIISDEEILLKLSGKHKVVLLLACAGCMNESLAFDSGLPIYEEVNKQISFPAIESECNRIVKKLKKHGISAEYCVIPSGTNSRCIINLDEPHYHIETSQKFDAVLVLSCPCGFQDISNQSSVPSYIVSKQIGALNYCYNQDSGCIKILSGKVTIFGE